jgi:hypothetical protein
LNNSCSNAISSILWLILLKGDLDANELRFVTVQREL